MMDVKFEGHVIGTASSVSLRTYNNDEYDYYGITFENLVLNTVGMEFFDVFKQFPPAATIIVDIIHKTYDVFGGFGNDNKFYQPLNYNAFKNVDGSTDEPVDYSRMVGNLGWELSPDDRSNWGDPQGNEL